MWGQTMRLALPALLLTAALAPAAPVPKDEAAEKKKLEALWEELFQDDPVLRLKAVFALVDHPKAAEFLAGKVPPIDATREQLSGWLKDLNDPDEKVWRPAFDQLRYHYPGTALTPTELVESVFSPAARFRLLSVLEGSVREPPLGTYRADLTLHPDDRTGRRGALDYRYRNGTGDYHSSMPFFVRPVDRVRSPVWERAATAALVLARIDTKDSRAVLERLATGHKDALPTTTAAEVLKAKPPAATAERFENDWRYLFGDEKLNTTRWWLTLPDRPDDVKRLAANLPAIKASKDEMTKWLTDLNDPDAKVWRPAFERMAYLRPVVALTPDEQFAAVTTDHGRAALFGLYQLHQHVPDTIVTRKDWGLAVSGGRVVFASPQPKFDSDRASADLPRLETFRPPHWQRARLAVVALERVKTDEAKAVLKQLADGHPDILPTKEAKAALKRLK
jgi:hypothetical protein